MRVFTVPLTGYAELDYIVIDDAGKEWDVLKDGSTVFRQRIDAGRLRQYDDFVANGLWVEHVCSPWPRRVEKKLKGPVTAGFDRTAVLSDINKERDRQVQKWGDEDNFDLPPISFKFNDPGSVAAQILGVPHMTDAREACEANADAGQQDWGSVIVEELAEVVEAAGRQNEVDLYSELIQLAAVAVSWAEALLRRPMTVDGLPRYSVGSAPVNTNCEGTGEPCPEQL